MNARIRAHRTVDLAAIRAVGFDLDHTLALYDDAAVNLIAANAARRLLVEQLHYPAWLAEATSPMLVPPAARALAADLRLGAIVKLDAARRVRRARLAGRWLTGDETGAAYPDGIPDSREWNYPVYSPFQLPVLWLLEEIESRWPAPADRRERCEHVRSMLDLAHTNGTLKSQLRDDVGRFVSGAPGLAGRLAAWASAGKTLFIVTNSEPDFATAVLDTALGPGWMELFRVVITAARKPAFFAPGARAWQDAPGTRARVVAGGSARYAETVLGAAGHDVLFVGDNLKSDVRAARAHGWQTVHVVPELDATPAADATGWGDALADAGSPTWLAELIRTHADVACAAVGDLLTLDPRGPIVPPTRRAAGETA